MNVAIDSIRDKNLSFMRKIIKFMQPAWKKYNYKFRNFKLYLYYTYLVAFECKFKKNAFNEC